MLATILGDLFLAILCLICLAVIALLLYALAYIIVVATKELKKEVKNNERNGIK